MIPMNVSRQAYHHGDLRNALVSAATDLVEQGGESSFSLREAARAVGVSANAAYRHFEDKSALLAGVAAIGFEQLSERMREAMARASSRRSKERPALARFKAVGRAYVEFAVEHPSIFRVMFGPSGVRCLESSGDDACETPWTLLGRALDALVKDGSLDLDSREGAELKTWTVVHGFASLAIDGQAAIPKGGQGAAALESVLDFAVRGILGFRLAER